MEISYQHNSPLFKSRCPEIRLGQDVCHLVNTEFPHYSLYKFKSRIEEGILRSVVKPTAIMDIMDKHKDINPNNYDNPISYFRNLFSSIKEHHYFNCHESALLSELILKLNGIKNSYTAWIQKGDAKANHFVCLFNRDGSEYSPNNKDSEIIIVDPWADLCDFKDNVLNTYKNIWSEELKPDILPENYKDDVYSIEKVSDISLSNEFLEEIKTSYPNLILKNIPQKKR